MFWHNFKYTLKNLLKNKPLIFWTFAFPLILGNLFFLAFQDIEKKEQLEIFNIAIVEKEKTDHTQILKNAYMTFSEGESELFHIEYVSQEKAEDLLSNKEITGYVILSETPKVVVSKNGIEETILKTVTESIIEEISVATTIQKEKIIDGLSKPEFDGNIEFLKMQVQKEVEEILKNTTVSLKDTSPTNLSYTMVEFYTLIAMTCLYGGMLTMTSINNNLANMCSTGKRIAVAPTKKRNVIFSSVLASFLVQLLGLALLFIYTIFVLNVDYGNKIFFIFLLSILGSLAGVALGCIIATLLKTNENTKIGILLAVTMSGSFFSGMMGITMKYQIDKNIPIINYLNPANMITDGLYSLYYYQTNTKFYFNVISLLIFSALLIILSIEELRRQKYDSI